MQSCCSSSGFTSLFCIFTNFKKVISPVFSSPKFLWGSGFSSRSCSSFPALVLPQEDVAVGTVMLCHIESWRTEGDESTWNTHSNKTETCAKSPSEDAGARFHPCSHVVLTVDTGEVNRVVTELGGDDQLGGYWRWCFVHWTNVWAPSRGRVGTDRIETVLVQALSIWQVMVGHGGSKGDVVPVDSIGDTVLMRGHSHRCHHLFRKVEAEKFNLNLVS